MVLAPLKLLHQCAEAFYIYTLYFQNSLSFDYDILAEHTRKIKLQNYNQTRLKKKPPTTKPKLFCLAFFFVLDST